MLSRSTIIRFQIFSTISAALFVAFHWLYLAINPEFYENLPLRAIVAIVITFCFYLPWKNLAHFEKYCFAVMLFVTGALLYISAMNNHAFVYICGLLLVMFAYPYSLFTQKIHFTLIYSFVTTALFVLLPVILGAGAWDTLFVVKSAFVVVAFFLFIFLNYTNSFIQNKVLAAEKLNKVISDALPGFVWCCQTARSNPDHIRCELLSRQWEQITGYPQSIFESNAHFVHRITVDEDKAALRAAFDKAIALGTAVCRHRVMPMAENTPLWLETRFFAETHPDDDIVHVYAISFDKTDILKAQNKMRQTERTLIHTHKIASVFSTMRSILHEIYDPIAVIKGHQDIIESKLDTHHPEARGLVSPNVAKQNQMLARMFDVMKKITLYADNDVETHADINLQSVIEDALALVRPAMEIKGVELQIQYKATRNFVRANGCQIQQSVLELLHNAMEAIEKVGHGVLSIVVENEYDDTGRHMLVIHIKDSGIGVREEHKDLLFSPFFTTKSTAMGAGLGLSVIRYIIEEHQGSITYASEYLKGATFTLRLPAKDRLTHHA